MAQHTLISKFKQQARELTVLPKCFFLRRAIHLILAIVLFLNTGCIHLPSAETKTVLPETSGPFTLNENSLYRIESLVYQPEKFPLDDFFARFKKGDFIEAFKSIRLSYQPSNTQNNALKELIEAGYSPVTRRFSSNSRISPSVK